MRKNSRRLSLPWIAVVLLGASALSLASVFARGLFRYGPTSLDWLARDFAAIVDSNALDALSKGLTAVGSTVAMGAIAIVFAIWLWWFRGHAAAAVVAAPVASALVAISAKLLTTRARPPGGMDHISWSFPSGHTATSTAVLFTIAFVMMREKVLSGRVGLVAAGAGAILIGVSRVYRDAHWATDVVGGWMSGLAVAGLSIALYLHLCGKQQHEEHS